MNTHTIRKITLNCDIGESFGAYKMGEDELIMPHIDCANIACGFHASDPLTMTQTVALAAQHQVKIGAHPSYPDLVGFGRRHMDCSEQEIIALIMYQVGALEGIAARYGESVAYVKPHGALYNDMLRDSEIFKAVCKAVSYLQTQQRQPLPLMVMATPQNSEWQALASNYDVYLWFEGFADRRYNHKGRLVSRKQSGSVLTEEADVLEQANRFARREPIIDKDGNERMISIDSLCVHGDNPSAVETVSKIRELLHSIPE
ncbi:MAG TPA: LamB/YcsF family protein [Idiomarina sp.]|jgi:UPF0271 protein|uniref:5-oxoprolinase subunit PxpA n=1 Tax=Idiomarina sp. TaxID=1874361 RepID=UPI000C914523|nr:5-oxoprolinase subunit PxpA [Idiomarina sp.]MAF75074.1 hypothetical protein [Idiomarinaceae bacterium]HAE90670.1 LamB/YcsF family protein [Idiomarina sp.]